MNVSLQAVDGNVTHVRIEGSVTQSDMAGFNDVLRDHFGPDIYAKHVLIDMSRVEWLDSSGVGWLLGCLKKFRHEDGSLVLYSLPSRVVEIFRVLHLHTTFRIAADAKAAEQMVEGGSRP
jgi:anti-anti-sigma factor